VDELQTTFTGPDKQQVVAFLRHRGDEESIAFCEFILRTPPGAGFAPDAVEDERVRARTKEDRDPGSMSLACLVAPRGQILKHTLIVRANGQEMHEDCVTGGVNVISWKVALPEAPEPDPVQPSGVTHEVAVGGDMSGSGETRATK
jgi:hypothetical protein